MGRLVWNHSTHVDGLIAILRKLAKCEGVATVTPGRMRNKRGKGHFRMTVSIPITGGWKVNARKGHMAQEVFVVTALSKEALQEQIDILVAEATR